MSRFYTRSRTGKHARTPEQTTTLVVSAIWLIAIGSVSLFALSLIHLFKGF